MQRLRRIRMTDHKKREKVVAEISLAHLMQCAAATGRALSQDEAIVFLNEDGRAYEMWKRMMAAGEDYIRSVLRSHPRLLVTNAPAHRNRPAV
jgi:hypothetical protein